MVDDDAVGEVGAHHEVVLDDEAERAGEGDEALEHPCHRHALLGVEVRAGLVEEAALVEEARGATRLTFAAELDASMEEFYDQVDSVRAALGVLTGVEDARVALNATGGSAKDPRRERLLACGLGVGAA